MALALARQRRRHRHRAVDLDVDRRALVRADAGALDVAGDPEADPAPLGAGGLAPGLEAGVVDDLEQLVEARLVVAGVVDRRPAVLEGDADVVGELVGPDEVQAPDLGPVEPELGRDAVHHPLHHERRVRAARAAVGRGRDQVREQRREVVAVVVEPVGARELRRADDRDDQPVRAVGAAVVHEARLEREDAAVLAHADPHVVDLLALVRGADEVLAPVLGPLDRHPEVAGGERDEDLLGIELDDLDAEAAADVGGHDVDLLDVHVEQAAEAAADAGRRLRGVVHQQGALLVEARHHGAALERRGGAALDLEAPLEHVRRLGHGGVDVAVLLGHAGDDVVGAVEVHQRRVRRRGRRRPAAARRRP